MQSTGPVESQALQRAMRAPQHTLSSGQSTQARPWLQPPGPRRAIHKCMDTCGCKGRSKGQGQILSLRSHTNKELLGLLCCSLTGLVWVRDQRPSAGALKALGAHNHNHE